MKHLTKLLFLLSLAFSFSANALDNNTDPSVYTEQKTSIFVTPDHPEFAIKLKSNPTTGYSWFLKNYDSQLIEAENHSYQATQTHLMGAPGYEIWTFKVKPQAFAVPQQISLNFVYVRPWEKNQPTKPLTFVVSTQGK